MTRLVSDLLQLTKFDYKKIAWNKIYFDLPELVKQICEKHKIQADTKKQILDCYITSNVPMVFADRDGMGQTRQEKNMPIEACILTVKITR